MDHHYQSILVCVVYMIKEKKKRPENGYRRKCACFAETQNLEDPRL